MNFLFIGLVLLSCAGLNGGLVQNGYNVNKQTDPSGVKFISLAAPLGNGMDPRSSINGIPDPRSDSGKSAGQ